MSKEKRRAKIILSKSHGCRCCQTFEWELVVEVTNQTLSGKTWVTHEDDFYIGQSGFETMEEARASAERNRALISKAEIVEQS